MDSQLTIRGMDQMFIAGTFVQRHYQKDGFLTDVYSPPDIYVRSSDYSRTLNRWERNSWIQVLWNWMIFNGLLGNWKRRCVMDSYKGTLEASSVSKAPAKWTWHFNATCHNIVEGNMLSAFAVAMCCGCVCSSNLISLKLEVTMPNISRHIGTEYIAKCEQYVAPHPVLYIAVFSPMLLSSSAKPIHDNR